jgi:ATP-binding cassette subfamily F protein 3
MLHIQELSKQFGPKTLFQGAEAFIGQRSKVALIGPNGAGKSTLIKIILGLESPDDGTVSRANHLAIGYLPQEIPKMSGATVLEETLRMDGRLQDLRKAKSEFEDSFSIDTPSSESLERYGRILEELEHLDEYRLEARAKGILGGMGFRPEDFDRKLSEFSGGWLMRVALSRILLMDPDLLLLDEPTNHLDLESLLWLEEFLRRHRGAMLIISHDIAFLNRLVDEVLEIDQRQLWSYRGNLDSYQVQKAERLKVLRSQYAGQQAKVAEIEAFVTRFGSKATKARQAQSKLKQLEKMDLIELSDARETVKFRFPPVPHSGKEIVTAQNASVRFGEKTIFKDLTWQIRKGTRTAIVGVNGAGKTTLLKLLAQELSSATGEVKLGHEVKIGYYSQMQAESLNFKNTVLQELENVAPSMPVAQVRAIAGAFLFSGEAVEKRCGVLSGGEKARVALAKLLLSPANFLILDEPTNHLDIESRGVLLDALLDYSGTLCLVSHDRDFVAPLVDTLLEIEPQPGGSKVIHSTKTYEDYLAGKLNEAAAQLSSSALNEKGPVTSKEERTLETTSSIRLAPSTNQKKSWQREKEKLEVDISRLEKEQSRLQVEMSDPATYSDKAKTLQLIQQQQDIEKELGQKMARWEEVSLHLES